MTFEEETGEVEDVRLTYTYIRLDNGRRLIVPNERLAQSSIENHTVVDPRVQVEVSVWLAPGGDATAASSCSREDEGVEAQRGRGRQGGHPADGDHAGPPPRASAEEWPRGCGRSACSGCETLLYPQHSPG